MKKSCVAKKLEIDGVVQGVGFRPFLFQLAHSYQLKGEVFNTANGVTLIIEGSERSIDCFCRDIVVKKPPLAIISEIHSTPLELYNHKAFVITQSCENVSAKSALISPDVSVCADCLKEMSDPEDRRFSYPFINCTNCGPRYTIIKDVPYDRVKTSMDQFKMCPRCQAEYDDPLDRRFHAQPNACPDCGPHVFILECPGENGNDSDLNANTNTNVNSNSDLLNIDPLLWDGTRKIKGEGPEFFINGKGWTAIVQSEKRAIKRAATLLGQGKILAVKGLGGFHLAVDALNPHAVERLRLRKQRPHKPFAVMASSVEAAARLVHISSQERELLESHTRPILLLERRSHSVGSTHCKIAPDNDCLGVMLPYTPLHYLLLEMGPSILVMTSGNRSGEPLSIENRDAVDAFSHIADAFLLHDRDIYFRADDSIVQFQNHRTRFLRRSRGYAPLPIFLKKKLSKRILACGGGLKSTVCLANGKRAFLSQHIGDLDNEKVFAFYKESIEHLKRILDIEPDVIVHDLHPGYMSTAYAEKAKVEGETGTRIPTVAVQHHHAHALACMAENGVEGETIAITLDGTGLGIDGHIWGGEILLCTEKSFERKAHLSYLPMPGGDAAVNEPWRMAVSSLYAAFGDDIFELDIPLIEEVGHEKIKFMIQMIKKKINTPLTSSCGRLFDSVASISSLCHKISFESQAAMALESYSGPPDGSGYRFMLNSERESGKEKKEKILQIETAPLINGVVMDLLAGSDRRRIGSKFHQTVIDMFVAATMAVHRETKVDQVVLSGGVFHNRYLLSGILRVLEKEKLTVYSHSKVPAGDGGLALGQVIAADAADI